MSPFRTIEVREVDLHIPIGPGYRRSGDGHFLLIVRVVEEGCTREGGGPPSSPLDIRCVRP